VSGNGRSVSELFSRSAAEIAAPAEVLLRLLLAALLGGVVALIYRRTRFEPASSFTTTLVLLAILIAMVTQVVGDNVARAFSLVGALSIVRFRTVVRDTQDTAYVIFAVAIGMAIGAHNLWVALIGVSVVALAAFVMRGRAMTDEQMPFRIQVRLGLGHDPASLLGSTLDTFTRAHRVMEVMTSRQGAAIDVSYRTALKDDQSLHALITALNRLEGVQSASVQRVNGGSEEP
jgi:uncharacterized membrane protein YhiD involved in acid resistance